MARRGRYRRNPREIPPWVIQTAIMAGGAFLVYKIGKALLDKLKGGLDKGTDALAKAIVGGSTVEISSGTTYQLPNGTRIKPSMTQSAGGADFIYTGVRYRLTAASPPGSGNYLAVKV